MRNDLSVYDLGVSLPAAEMVRQAKGCADEIIMARAGTSAFRRRRFRRLRVSSGSAIDGSAHRVLSEIHRVLNRAAALCCAI